MADLQLQREQDNELHGQPWVSLAYLFFVLLPLVFWPDRPMSAIYASAAAILVFLPVYFADRKSVV